MKLALAATLVVISAVAAEAAPLTPPSANAVAPSTAVETVHFRHRSCQLGVAGWHYHFRGDRIPCRPFRVIRRY